MYPADVAFLINQIVAYVQPLHVYIILNTHSRVGQYKRYKFKQYKVGQQ